MPEWKIAFFLMQSCRFFRNNHKTGMQSRVFFFQKRLAKTGNGHFKNVQNGKVASNFKRYFGTI